ncbi:hypothetical protein, partial [Streptomyces cahuitamycinicus]
APAPAPDSVAALAGEPIDWDRIRAAVALAEARRGQSPASSGPGAPSVQLMGEITRRVAVRHKSGRKADTRAPVGRIQLPEQQL